MWRASILAAVLAAAAAAASAQVAAPSYILVTGPGLGKPALLASWAENGALLASLVTAPAASPPTVSDLARRPRYRLSEFWGPPGTRPPTRPSEAQQHGWFYPAYGARPAVFVVVVDGSSVPRVAPARALRILARHGIPRRLSPRLHATSSG